MAVLASAPSTSTPGNGIIGARWFRDSSSHYERHDERPRGPLSMAAGGVPAFRFASAVRPGASHGPAAAPASAGWRTRIIYALVLSLAGVFVILALIAGAAVVAARRWRSRGAVADVQPDRRHHVASAVPVRTRVAPGMATESLSFLRRRIHQEERMVGRASSPAAARAHGQMAEAYRDRMKRLLSAEIAAQHLAQLGRCPMVAHPGVVPANGPHGDEGVPA